MPNVAWSEDFQMYWPDTENANVFRYMLMRVTDVDVTVKHCRTTGVAVQAGSFLGMWPARLAKYFERVHSFEPIPHLFECAKLNTQHLPNVRVYNKALGDRVGSVQINEKRGGCTHVVEGGRDTTDQVTIDSLDLIRCDAILLDIERYELAALTGARETIARCRPVITLEMKADTRDEYVAFMEKLGYQHVTQVHADWIFVPK